MTTPAGWYPEPDGNQQRYWDGEKWTEHVAPLSGAQPTAGAAASTTSPSDTGAVPLQATGETVDDTGSGGGSTGKILGGVAAAALVAIAGLFAYTQLAGADGGSDSPEAAVEDLMDAFSNEDLVGVAESVLPGERRTYVDPTLEGLGHLQRWGVLSDDLDTNDVAGVDFEIDGLELRTEVVADDVVNVYASGSITAALDGANLPIGDVITSRMDEDPSELDEPAETEQFDDVMITTVNEDGRWYVSAMYTIGEHARAGAEAPMPAGIEAIGASSPEAAVDGMVDALGALDLEGVIARLNPDEAAALQRYAPLFLDEAQAELDDAAAEAGLSIDIDVDTEVTRRDDIALVDFTAFSVRAEADGEVIEMTFDGECSTITADGETEEVCATDGSSPSIDFTDTPAGDLTAIFDDMEATGLVVAQRDGEWFVSPIRTYSETILAVMRAIDRDEFDRIVDALEDGSLEDWFEDELQEAFGGELEDMFDELESDGIDEWDDLDGSSILDDLVDSCQAGEMEACDDLYWSSAIGSPEEIIALTCGGTIPQGDQAGGNCATGEPVFGDAESYGDDPELDALWDACESGDMLSCDDLFWSSGIDSDYEAFAQSCGGRLNDEVFGDCVTELGATAG